MPNRQSQEWLKLKDAASAEEATVVIRGIIRDALWQHIDPAVIELGTVCYAGWLCKGIETSSGNDFSWAMLHPKLQPLDLAWPSVLKLEEFLTFRAYCVGNLLGEVVECFS